MIGTTLQHRYRLDAELGRGGMGTVYRAHDSLLDRPVAVKVLSSTTLGTEGRARLLREARAAARLNHPGIMAVHDAGEENGAPYIVMELLHGQTLRQLSTPGLAQTIAIGRAICAALEHAHAAGVVHRDLKPENVMVLSGGSAEREARIKLMDFGLAFTSDAARLTHDGAFIGTANYVAPEIIEGQTATAASDLYAVGVMLYELLAGRPPFVGDSLMAILSQHLYAPVVPPSTYQPSVPDALDSLIVKLLSKRPEDRPASAAEVRRALEQLDQTSALVALPDRFVPLSALDRIARGRLIGREHELAEARAVWQRAASGEGCVLLISGEPGIGKTRFARELTAQARVTGGQVLFGECHAEGMLPYGPITEMLHNRCCQPGAPPMPDLTTSILADLITIAPELRANFPHVPPNPPQTPQAEQLHLFESVAAFVTAVAAKAPLMIVIDDAHWADSATLLLLRHLARRARSSRLLLVLTYREIELDEARPFHEAQLDFHRERLATRLKLTRLDRAQTEELLSALFQSAIEPDFAQAIYRETEGNPFFIEEVCKALIESGKVYRADGRWQQASLDEIEIPQSVRLAIQTRLGKLPEAAQDTLRLGAVLGREFDFEVLRAMSDLDEERLIDALEAAERAQLIGEVPRSGAARSGAMSFAFAHALIPATLYDGVSGLRRQRLHRRAAQAMERAHADRLASGEFAAAIGRHYAEAGDADKAIDYLLQAGDRARRMSGYREAITHYQQALGFLKEQGPIGLARAARTAMSLGLLHQTFFDFDQSREAYQEAFTLWQQASDQQAQTALPPAPHALRGFWSADRTSLDPALAMTSDDIQTVEQLFSGLAELSPEYDVVPVLARRWEVLDGGRRYVFYLRSDCRWSDGWPVTAHDVEYAWKRLLSPALDTPNAEFLMDLKGARAYRRGEGRAAEVGVRATDDHTLVVELDEPIGHFMYVMTLAAMFPVPRHVVEQAGADWWRPEHLVTNGPFRLAEWQYNRRMVLERDPNYRGPVRGNVQRVELTLVHHLTRAGVHEKYEAGLHDVASLDGADMIEWARRQYPGEYFSAPVSYTLFLAFDTTRPPFDDARVRRALAHAINQQTLAENVHRGVVAPALGGLVPPGMPGHSPRIGLAFDPGKARQLLAEAGYPGGQGFPSIEAWTTSGGEFNVNPTYVATQWREQLNIDIRWTHFDWTTYFKQLATAGPPQLYRMAWIADYPDADTFLYMAMRQPYVRWHNPQYERLIETARHMADPVERIKFYQAAERLLVDEAAFIPLLYGCHHFLIKPWIKQLPVSAMKASYWKDVIIEPHE